MLDRCLASGVARFREALALEMVMQRFVLDAGSSAVSGPPLGQIYGQGLFQGAPAADPRAPALSTEPQSLTSCSARCATGWRT